MQKRKATTPPPPIKPPPLLSSLSLSLSLANYPKSNSIEPTDFFDSLDAQQPPLTAVLTAETDGPKVDHNDFISVEQARLGPLVDSTGLLYPNLASLTEMAEELEGMENLPTWLRETSGRGRILVATEISIGGIESNQKSLRVGLAAEDGSIWIFGEESRNAESKPAEKERITPSSIQINFSPSLSPSPSRNSIDSHPPDSPDSINSSSPRPGPPSTTSNLRNISSSYLRNNPRHPTTPSSLISSTNNSIRRIPSTTGSISPSRNSYDHTRARKASATVSTNTAIELIEGPLSPTLSSFASPTLKLSSPTRENYYQGNNESVGNGIGLWETESVMNFHSEDFEEEEEVQLNTMGEGAIVGMKVVEKSRFGIGEDGTVLLVLRVDVQLSIHSFIDGRVLGRCHVGDAISSSARQGTLAFAGFELIAHEETTIVLVYSTSGIGYIFINLDSLEMSEPIETESNLLRPVIFSSEESTYLLYPSATESIPRILSRQITLAGVNSSLASAVIVAEFSQLESIKGLEICGENMLIFDEKSLLLFTIGDQGLVLLAKLEVEGIMRISVKNDFVAVVTQTKIATYQIIAGIAAAKFEFKLLQNADGSHLDCISSLENASFLLARPPIAAPRSLEVISKTDLPRTVFTASPFNTKPARITLSLPSDRDTVILGFSDGRISLHSYSKISKPIQEVKLTSAVTLLKIFTIRERKILIGGCAGGSTAAWNLSDLSSLARWNLFPSSATSVHLSPSKISPKLIFLSTSSVAIISLESFELIFLLPGTAQSIGVEGIWMSGKEEEGEGELLIIYGSGLSRIWDLKGGELRRSMERGTARGVLVDKSAGWRKWFEEREEMSLGRLDDPVLTIDLRTQLEALASFPRSVPIIRSSSNPQPVLIRSETLLPRASTPQPGAASPLTSKSTTELPSSIGFLLSQLLDFNLDISIDGLLALIGNVAKPDRFDLVLNSFHSLIVPYSVEKEVWKVSATASAQRLLFLTTLLQVSLRSTETRELAKQVIDFYSNNLATSIGAGFCSPTLDVFAIYWLDPSPEIQNSARSLFRAYVAEESDSNIVTLVERWSSNLFAEGEGEQEKALLVIGLIATDRFMLLPPTTLKEVAQLMSSYLIEFPSIRHHQTLAVEILSLGFEIWQAYFSPPTVLRRLFSLAMGKEELSLRTKAREAVERIVEVERGLVVSTISEDILWGEFGVRKDMIKLIGLIVKKQPLVLFTSLPRLVEAVVKSLDPAVREAREMVQGSATVLLNQLVRTYPSIAFHGPSQRLAVGTSEGPIIIYDLGTAARLNVLSSHNSPVAALSFSEDGRRLVTASLVEGKVLVWKVGGAIAGFNPVAPLYSLFGLGGKNSEVKGVGEGGPAMVLDFIVGEEGEISLADTLEFVVFSWPSERTARLKIRETILTFSV